MKYILSMNECTCCLKTVTIFDNHVHSASYLCHKITITNVIWIKYLHVRIQYVLSLIRFPYWDLHVVNNHYKHIHQAIRSVVLYISFYGVKKYMNAKEIIVPISEATTTFVPKACWPAPSAQPEILGVSHGREPELHPWKAAWGTALA